VRLVAGARRGDLLKPHPLVNRVIININSDVVFDLASAEMD